MMNPNPNPASKQPILVVVGGGAAGFFGAIKAAETNRNLKVILLERNRELLQKVKISGGGRCNVTHACFNPKELTRFYPRGEKALLGPFHKFGATETIEWFAKRGVELKTEPDRRIFPVSDSSQTIIDCFLNSARRYKIEIHTETTVKNIQVQTNPQKYTIETADNQLFVADFVLWATGSSPAAWEILAGLGYELVPPVPSLFTFNLQKDPRWVELSGVSVPNVEVWVKGQPKLRTNGALLVTHKGLSAYSVLRLSAWGARMLHDCGYKFDLCVDWTGGIPPKEVSETLDELKQHQARRRVWNYPQFGLATRLWELLLELSEVPAGLEWANINKKQITKLLETLTRFEFVVVGKNTFKEEFVTAGGLALSQIDFTRFESRLHPNFFFAGEVLDIDAITGGFNFQAAWTGGFLAGLAIGGSAPLTDHSEQ
jgi:predicted Rossmann fold flavoprotein